MLALLLAASVLSPLAARAGDPLPSDLGITVQDLRDINPGNPEVRNEAGENGYASFYLTIGYVSDSYPPPPLDGVTLEISGTGLTSTGLLTPGCTWVTDRFSCPLETIVNGEAQFFVQRTTPAATTSPETMLTTTFTLVPPPGFVDDDATNNSDSIDTYVMPDVLSLWMASYPRTSPAGAVGEFQALIRNGSASTATGVELQVRFPDASLASAAPIVSPTPCDPYVTEDDSLDGQGDPVYPYYDFTRPYRISCPLADIANGELLLPIRLTLPSCPVGEIDCTIDLSFRVVYAQVGTTFQENDEDYRAAYIRDEPAGQDVVAQESALPVATPVTVSSLDGNGLSATDPTAATVTDPATFTGFTVVAEVDQSQSGSGPGTESVSTNGAAAAAPVASPAPRDCATDRSYPLDCQEFNLRITSPIVRNELVYRLVFLLHSSAFRNDVTGKLLKISATYLFHEDLIVAACPKGTKESNYLTKVPSGDPCLLAKRIGRSTGYYEFVVLTQTNGRWKIGR